MPLGVRPIIFRRLLSWGLPAVGLLAILFILLYSRGARAPLGTEETGTRRLVRYGFHLRNRSASPLQGSAVRVFAPLAVGGSHRRISVTSSRPYSITSEREGGESLEFLVDVAPYGSAEISVDAVLEVFSSPLPARLNDPARYLAEEANIELSDPEISRLAQEVKGGNEIETARRTFNWVAANLKDRGYVREDRGARWALQNREGDCTEFSLLFVALMRRNAIPARVMGGFVVERDSRIRAGQYHNWAEFFVNGRWDIADPLEGVFADKRSAYVAFREVYPSSDSGVGSAQRFIAVSPALEASLQ